DIVHAMVIAGIIQCAIVTMLLIRYCGILPAIAYNFMYYRFSLGEYFLISIHHGLILMTILYLRFEDRNARRAMSFIFAVADPLFSFIQGLFLLTRSLFGHPLDRGEFLLMLLGYALAFYLCESSFELAKFGPALAIVLLAAGAISLGRPHKALVFLENKVIP